MENTIKKLNYISLFSSAGVGCYAFKKENFECIATCELMEKRLEIQKYNNKCKLPSGYICGDITNVETENLVFNEIYKWNKVNNVDIIIATPPCQGMSVANQKKNSNDIKRNSLVLKAIELVKKINPKIFIFENVGSFLKTIAVDDKNESKMISEHINDNLSDKYAYISNIYNFKNFGSNSSRTRTLVIGVRSDFLNEITPFEIIPNFTVEKTLHEVIGNFKKLNKMGEFDSDNILHSFKSYDTRIRQWINNLKEGESAFDNSDINRVPHRIINGKVCLYKRGFGDKYKRQLWNKVASCIHTANDCLASQNTIHPNQDRVFSIAELMKMMSIPDKFKWTSLNLNNMSDWEKTEWLKKNEGNIRKCIGEAVPTGVFERIAKNIKDVLINKNDLYSVSKKFELNNLRKNEDAAFYTTRINLSYIYDILPDFKSDTVNILEPSVGTGNFLIPIIKKYQSIRNVNIDVCDINNESLKSLQSFLKSAKIPKNIKIRFIHADFLNNNFKKKYDLVIGNPPFKLVKIDNTNKNLFELFWIKSLALSSQIIFINPKYMLSSTNYDELRRNLSKSNITNIIDFGEMGFKDVKIETIAIKICNITKTNYVQIYSVPKKIKISQRKNYIFSDAIPYWIIYRDKQFDYVYNKMKKDIFNIYKNYELSNNKMFSSQGENMIWIVRSKNIAMDHPSLVHIDNYDRYANEEFVKATKFFKYINSAKTKLYLIPTLTYYPRVIEKEKNCFVNGSVLVAELKDPRIVLTDNDLKYYYSDEFRYFYSVAFNYSTRTLNVDTNTIKFFGIVRENGNI